MSERTPAAPGPITARPDLASPVPAGSEPAGPARAPHPRHGIHRPSSGTPPRAPSSVRRTSTIDSLRLAGIDGPVTVLARVRDLVTGPDGSVAAADTTDLHADVDYFGGYLVRELRSDPDEPRLGELVGRRASAGFRAAVNSLLPGSTADRGSAGRSRLRLLLDDLPGAILVSGDAVLRAGFPGRPAGPVLQQSDLCSGWRTGGTILLEIERHGNVPVVTGPVAGDLGDPTDPDAWHPMDPLPPRGMRRRRRLDVRWDDGLLWVDALLRDSHMGADGVETSIHEYAVQARVDPNTLRVEHAEAYAHALPWVECDSAVDSAADVVGRTVGELRTWVRTGMTGTRTCTHLNDTLRSFDDVDALRALLPGGDDARPTAPVQVRDQPNL